MRRIVEQDMDFFMESIAKFKPLTNNEIKKILYLAQQGDNNASWKLILHNMRLIISVANSYAKRFSNIDIRDLTMAGIDGIFFAIKNYQFNKDTKFSTYAVIWIKQTIARYCVNCINTIRIPLGIIANEEKKITKSYPTTIFWDDIKSKNDARSSKIVDNSLGMKLLLYKDEIPDILFNKNLNFILEELCVAEKCLIKNYFIDCMTLTEIGKNFGITKEAVRQRLEKLLKKLRGNKKIRKIATECEYFKIKKKMIMPKRSQTGNIARSCRIRKYLCKQTSMIIPEEKYKIFKSSCRPHKMGNTVNDILVKFIKDCNNGISVVRIIREYLKKRGPVVKKSLWGIKKDNDYDFIKKFCEEKDLYIGECLGVLVEQYVDELFKK